MPFVKTTKEIWDKTIEINLTGAFLCIQQVINGMTERGYGKVVNISSRSGMIGSKGFASYSASKFGEIGLTQSVANEFAKNHINVNAICPGIVFTPMWEKQLDDYISLKGYNPDDMQAELVRKIPMDRLQTEEDIANAVLFLVSDMSKNITGQALMVTGGY
jgi:NAD(P)-dependent dehydrogenase (short-subunit alcohol dehydrogenase family)